MTVVSQPSIFRCCVFLPGHPTVCPVCGQHLLEGWSKRSMNAERFLRSDWKDLLYSLVYHWKSQLSRQALSALFLSSFLERGNSGTQDPQGQHAKALSIRSMSEWRMFQSVWQTNAIWRIEGWYNIARWCRQLVSPYVNVWSKLSYVQESCQEQTPSTSSNHLTFRVCVDLWSAAAWTKIVRTHATGDRSKGVGESHGLPVKNSTLVGLASTN